MDSKLDPSLQSDRAAGKAAKLRLFWAVCCEGLRHGRSVGSGHQLCGNHSLPVVGKNTLGGECLSPGKTRGGDSKDSHLNDLGKPPQLGGG